MYVNDPSTLVFCNTLPTIVMNGYKDGINGIFRDEWCRWKNRHSICPKEHSDAFLEFKRTFTYSHILSISSDFSHSKAAT